MKTIVIAGNGMVGHKFVQKFADLDKDKQYKLITFSEEPRLAYDRVHLSEFFDGKSAEDLSLTSMDEYRDLGVEVHIGDKIEAVDPSTKSVITSNGKDIAYDKLILATGSFPFVPPIPGTNKEGVFVYRTIEDLEDIMAFGKKSKSAAVIGGGLLGLEAAKALKDMNLETHVVEFAPRLMPRQLDEQGAEILKRKIEGLGVTVHLNKATKEIIGKGITEKMLFQDGTELAVDMVLISAGIRPRDELAKPANLDVGKRGGIVVNDFLQTSDPDIYAIGECALHNNFIYGLVAPGYTMAETAAKHILGLKCGFAEADMSTKLKLMGIDVGTIGDSTTEIKDDLVDVIYLNRAQGVYKKLIIHESDNTLAGAVLVGDASDYGNLLQLYLNKMTLPEKPESLIVEAGEKSAVAGVDALPDTAQICSCENVSKGQIIADVQAGATTVADIKKCNKAGTGCGSCVPLITDLIQSEMKKQGKEIDRSLCPHFKHSRQELLDIVRVKKINTFEELLSQHGTGKGCEICKPAVASMLASYRNEFVVKHQNIQDTNDQYLANIQKNGTYSVVPRVPGGEITPEQLIRIGEVAKEFNLYSKITGAQRIDLFGARVDQLPTIWAKLGEVGLETGHAYAKALRTVKTCVGNVWCRFGVGDSTKLGIDIENRYKGLRTPHKVKMAVSGCARECAEAQGKDVGIIATDHGWNLYVCGNGGMKPQHAELIASDIDEGTLIKYVDRFLMYYVRTADKLMRTATWLNKLEGGLEKLKQVIIEDSLGICDELEKEMQHVVDTYACEWQKVYENVDVASRFKHFINSNDVDENVSFEMERGQIKPLIRSEHFEPIVN